MNFMAFFSRCQLTVLTILFPAINLNTVVMVTRFLPIELQ